MKKLMNFLMLSCKKATELIEKRSVTELSAKEKFQLKMHTHMCSACRAYEGQSETMDKALDEFTRAREKPRITLSDEVKARIIRNLREE